MSEDCYFTETPAVALAWSASAKQRGQTSESQDERSGLRKIAYPSGSYPQNQGLSPHLSTSHHI